MNVLLLSYEYPPDTGFGGIGTYTWYHARALARLGHQVHVLAGSVEPARLHAKEHDGVTVFRYRMNGSLSRTLWSSLGRLRLWWTRIRLDNAISMYSASRSLRRQYRYDIVEMPECGAEGMLINRLTDARTVVRLHSPARLIMPFYDVSRTDMALCSFAEQRGISTAGSFTSCSRFLADEARREVAIDKDITVIPNGIDIELFDQEDTLDFRSHFGLPMGRPMIFFAARMERRKGVHLLRQIVGSVLARHDVAFVMAGQDLFDFTKSELEPYLASLRLKGSFHFLGRLDLATVRSGVRQSDIFVLPSLWENCPYSCLEAMAAGRAIVSTDHGGMPELIVDGENGLLARSGSAAAYVDALDILLGDEELRLRLGRAARRTVQERFTDVQTARLAIEHYTRHLADES